MKVQFVKHIGSKFKKMDNLKNNVNIFDNQNDNMIKFQNLD